MNAMRSLVVVLSCLADVAFLTDTNTHAVNANSAKLVSTIVTSSGFGIDLRRAVFKIQLPTTAARRPRDSFRIIMEGALFDLQAGDIIALRLEGADGVVEIGDLTAATPDGATLEARRNGLKSVKRSTIGGFWAKVRARTKHNNPRVIVRLARGTAGASPVVPAASPSVDPVTVTLLILRGTTLIEAEDFQNFEIKTRTTARGLMKIRGRYRPGSF
jgi:hypothetical protein